MGTAVGDGGSTALQAAPSGYLAGVTAETFDLREYLRAIDPVHAAAMLQDSACRVALTRWDPLLFALIYMSRTITDKDNGTITFADMHFELCRMALGWAARSGGGHGQRTAVLAPRDAGKALALDTPVLSDRGWVAHGDLKSGDVVYGPDGRERNVLGVRHWRERPCYRVGFSDGTAIVADAGHEWLVHDQYRERELIRTTEEMAQDWLLTSRRGWREVRYRLPAVAAVELPGRAYPLDPYVVGAWLGDGHSGGTAFTSADGYIVERIRAAGHVVIERGQKYLYGMPGFIKHVRKLFIVESVASNYAPKFVKRIPEEYFWGSVDQRLALMQGLMDTDGSIDHNGRAEYCSTLPGLAADVLRLARMLGIKASLRESDAVLNGRVVGRRYRVHFKTSLPVFGLPRKAARVRRATRGEARKVVSVEPVAPRDTNCIEVDGDHLYLAGESLVPTHNSSWLFKILPLWAAAHGHVRFAAAFTATGRQAERWMGNVKRELEGNALLRGDFPELCQPAVRPRTGRSVADTQSLYSAESGFILAAFGIDSSNLGLNVDDRRPDLIIFDDIEQDEANYSQYQKGKRLTTVIDTCMGMNLKATVSFVGTVTMTGSIFHDFVRLNDGEPDEDNRWVEEQRISIRHFEPFVDERSYWPGRWSTEFLRSIQHTNAFAKNLLNRPTQGDGDYWAQSDFSRGTLATPAIQILSIDPAVKDKKTNDYTAMSVIAFDPSADIGNPAGGKGAFEVIDSIQMRVVPGQPLVQRVLAVLATHPGIYAVLIEDNQGGQLWNMLFADLPVQLWTVTHTEPKWVRAQKVVNEYQLGKVLHRRPLVKLERQMVSFPRVINDDLVDSVTSGVLELRRRYSVAGVDRVGQREYS